MQTRDDYKGASAIQKQLRARVKTDPYRLGFHMMPPTGWLNDPNGLCSFQGRNHIYFQYTPLTPTWGIKSWGHYTTSDWIHYKEEEPFLFADHAYDKDGVYSGSAFVKDDQIHYFYTGNVKYTDKDYTYITDGREQNTIEVISNDGFTYDEKMLVFRNQDYPSDMSCHVRDPKIFEKNNVYYMVLGARSVDDIGCVLLYRSDDLNTWTYHMRIQTKEPFGYMWECPDLFELDGQLYLICCPQGVATQGVQYQNIYQFGYFKVDIDFDQTTYELSEFHELDKGFDIYAPQSFEDEQGRRILLAWMGIPDAPYHNEKTVEKGWQHALTMPRELYQKNGLLCQRPLDELKALRGTLHCVDGKDCLSHDVTRRYEAILSFKACDNVKLQLRKGIMLVFDHGLLSLQLDACGCGRDVRSVEIQELNKLQIFMDTSSIEIFINDGEDVMTTRYYTQEESPFQMEGSFAATVSLYELNEVQIEELEVE